MCATQVSYPGESNVITRVISEREWQENQTQRGKDIQRERLI